MDQFILRISPGNEKNRPEVRSAKNQKMVELVGVEPMTYTMRTYRSSQLSYSPIFRCRTGFS